MPFDSTTSPEAFRALGHAVIDRLADYLDSAAQKRMPVLPAREPSELLHQWAEKDLGHVAAPDPNVAMMELVDSILEHSTHLHHPGYVGHQVAVPHPHSVLLEMLHSLLSNGMAVYEMGQLQTVLERRVVEYLCATIGYDSTSGGVLTHGGSLGNLTALLAARQTRADHDIWTDGQQEPMTVLVSDQAHYCISRATRIMGWGEAGAWSVPTNEAYSMDFASLTRAHEEAMSSGRNVIAVVVSACSTATGSFDPIAPIADYCAEHNLWLHVDGAHGASHLFSTRYRDVLSGIERADSVVWDLHKMASLPALNTALLFKNDNHSYEAFAQQASYLFDEQSPSDQWFNLAQKTLECTKKAMGVTTFGMLKIYGASWFANRIDRLIELTCTLEAQLDEAPDFDVATPAQTNILCFRYLPESVPDSDALNQLQRTIRHRIIEDGRFYLVQTELKGKIWLRVTVMNPETTPHDLDELVSAIRKAARAS